MADPYGRDPMMQPGFDPMADPRQVPWEPDPFAVETYGPAGTPIAGWEDPRGDVPSIRARIPWDYEQAIAGTSPALAAGQLAGDVNRAKLEGQRALDPSISHLGEAPGPGDMPGQRELTLRDLLGDVPMYQSTGSTSITEPMLTPEQVKEYHKRWEKAAGQERASRTKLGAIAREMHTDTERIQKESALRQKAEYVWMMGERAKVEAKVSEQMADNNRMLQEIKDFHVNPERMYEGEGGGFRKFAHVLGVALGSFGASLTKTPNFALQIVESQLNRDMQAQMAELSKKKFAYQAGRSALADLYHKTGDIEQSYLLTKALYLDVAKADIAAIGSRAQSREVVQASAIQNAALDRASIANDLELQKHAYRKVTKTHGPKQMTPAATAIAVALAKAKLGGATGAGGAGAGKAGKPMAAAVNKVDGAVETLIGLKRVEKMLPETNPIAPPVPGESLRKALQGRQTRKFLSQQLPLTFSYTKAMTGVAGAEKERQRYVDRFVQGWDPTGVVGERSREEQLEKLAGIKQQMLDILRTNAPILRMKIQQDPKLLQHLGKDVLPLLR